MYNYPSLQPKIEYVEKPKVIISQISELKQAGVWKDFSADADVKLEQRTLIYGFNGTGKTILSRVLYSIQMEKLEDRLPEETIFKLKTSNDIVITQANISNPFGKNLLVFNTDFVARNFLWDDSSTEGIVYLSEKNIDDKQELDAINEQLPKVQEQIEKKQKEYEESETYLKKLRTQVARNVREKAILNTYTHSYNATKIKNRYSKGSFNTNKKLSDNDFRGYQDVLSQREEAPSLNFSPSLPNGFVDWFKTSQSLLSQSISSIAEKAFESHSDALRWIEKGLHYHDEHSVMECLLCGNTFSEERRAQLRTLFDASWTKALKSLEDSVKHGQTHLQALRDFYSSIPKEGDIIIKERENFIKNKKSMATAIEQIGKCAGEILEGLETRADNPIKEAIVSKELEDFNLDAWLAEYARIESALETILDKHKEASTNFKAMQDEAFKKIEEHILATHQEEYRSDEQEIADILEALSSARDESDTLTKRQEELQINLQDHGIGAKRINELIALYLGHKEIQFAAQNNGYKILRSNGIPAKNMSEGERMAISFCYFLTQLDAAGRQIKDLVLVIDDPISSLDTTAQSHAYGLMTRMTENCAQVIVLTHNMRFMNMVKRGFKGYKKALLSLDCRALDSENGDNRTTELVPMPELLEKHDSEYHYLFSLVYDAAKHKNTDKLFLLPNATRKLLEMFAAFCSPEKTKFSEALMDYKNEVKDKLNVQALERLVQMESHAIIDGFTSLPELTTEEAIRAAEATINFIRIVEEKHYDKMCLACGLNQSS